MGAWRRAKEEGRSCGVESGTDSSHSRCARKDYMGGRRTVGGLVNEKKSCSCSSALARLAGGSSSIVVRPLSTTYRESSQNYYRAYLGIASLEAGRPGRRRPHRLSPMPGKEVVRGRGARGRGCTRSERAGARGALLVVLQLHLNHSRAHALAELCFVLRFHLVDLNKLCEAQLSQSISTRAWSDAAGGLLQDAWPTPPKPAQYHASARRPPRSMRLF
eukprot:COSAG02_NODE_2465_length_8785_cov_21.743610_2_plen_218_part_00